MYQNSIPIEIKEILHALRKNGNEAAHEGKGDGAQARLMLRKYFRLAQWFYELYEGDIVSTTFALPANKFEKRDDDELKEELDPERP